MGSDCTAQNVVIPILTFQLTTLLKISDLKILLEFTVGDSWFHRFRHRSAFSHAVYLHIQRPNRWNYHLMSIFHFFPRVDENGTPDIPKCLKGREYFGKAQRLQFLHFCASYASLMGRWHCLTGRNHHLWVQTSKVHFWQQNHVTLKDWFCGCGAPNQDEWSFCKCVLIIRRHYSQ